MNTHYDEKLRLAEASDGTRVWVNKGNGWFLSGYAFWHKDEQYVVADGFYEEERKAFYDGETIQSKSLRSANSQWDNVYQPTWSQDFTYRIKPKKWYEMEENIGKIIWASDANSKSTALLRIFEGYDSNGDLPFKTNISRWRYAWLVSPDELAKEK